MKQKEHNRRFLLLLTILLVATFGMAQTVIVKDSITNESIPFVSVYFGNETGGYTDEKGMIAIPNEATRIRLSHICYETRIISKITADLQTIFLVPKSINLDEVAISAKALKRTKTTEVGLMKAKTQTKHKGANGFEMALFIPYDSTWAETPYMEQNESAFQNEGAQWTHGLFQYRYLRLRRRNDVSIRRILLQRQGWMDYLPAWRCRTRFLIKFARNLKIIRKFANILKIIIIFAPS